MAFRALHAQARREGRIARDSRFAISAGQFVWLAEMTEPTLDRDGRLIVAVQDGDRTYRATRLKAGQGAAIVVFWDE